MRKPAGLTWWSWRSSADAVHAGRWCQRKCQAWRNPTALQRCCQQWPKETCKQVTASLQRAAYWSKKGEVDRCYGHEEERQTRCRDRRGERTEFKNASIWIFLDTNRGRRSTDAAVEAVEGGVEIKTWAQAVHLKEHLSQEQSEEQKLCIV